MLKIIQTTITDFFARGHSRTLKAKKNIAASFAIKGISIVIGLVMVPLTIDYVNPTRYGIWLTLGSIIGWLGFFDIGFGNGLRNKFAEAIAKGDHKLAKTYLSTTYAILGLIILLLLIIFLSVNPFLDWSKILNTPAEMSLELSTLVTIVFVFFCIQFVLKLITTIITADQQPAKASFFDLLGKIFSLLIVFILIKTTNGSLIYLGIALSSTPVIVLSVSSLWFYQKDYKQFAPSFKYVNFKYARNLMGLGIKFFIIQIAGIVLFQTTNIIISQLFGPAQVTPYNIAYKYFGIVTMLFSIIITPFWSAFTEAWAKQEISWIKSTIRKLQIIWLLFSILIIFMLLVANFAYRMWVGEEIIVPIGLSVIMASYIIITLWCGIYSHFLNGVGKIKLQLYYAILATLVNIPLAIFLGKNIGIEGIVLATVILQALAAIWSPLQYYKIINNKANGLWNK
jgi:O-antigen/teichoic acid export membrane protein